MPLMSLCEALFLNSMFTLDNFVVRFVHGKVIVLFVSTLFILLSGIYPFSALNPDCSFV